MTYDKSKNHYQYKNNVIVTKGSLPDLQRKNV